MLVNIKKLVVINQNKYLLISRGYSKMNKHNQQHFAGLKFEYV